MRRRKPAVSNPSPAPAPALRAPAEPRQPLSRLAAVLIAATVVRVVYFIAYLSSPCNGFLAADHIYYREWALNIAAGDWVGQGTFEQGPLYAYLLALAYLVGLSEPAIIFLQFMTGVAVCLLVFLCGRRLFDERIATAAALATALYGPLLFYEMELMKSFLSPLFVVTTLYAGLRYTDALQKRWASLAGVAIGLACLLRESYILLALPTALWIWLNPAGRQQTRLRRLGGLLVFMGSLGLTLAPSAARNAAVAGEFVVVTTGGGEVMYIAHGPKATGYWNFGALPPTKMNPRQEHQAYRDEAARRTGRVLTAADSSRYWYGEALREVKADPGRFVRLTVRRGVILLNDFEMHDSSDYQTWRELIPLLYPLPSFGWIIGPGIIGVCVCLPDWRRCGLAIGLIAMVVLGVLLTYNFGRFRIGMTPILILFAAAGVFRVVSLWRSGQRRERIFAATAACACLGVTVVAFLPPPGYEGVYSDAMREHWRSQVFARQKARQKASELAAVPNPDARLRSDLGHEFMVSGHIREGMQQHRAAMQQAPGDARPVVAFSSDLFAQGYESESIELIRESIRINPAYGSAAAQNLLVLIVEERPDLLLQYGPLLAEVGEEACRATQRSNPALLYSLAAVYDQTRRFPEAIRTAEEALALARARGDQPLTAKLQQFLGSCRQRQQSGPP
jgi:4-amino-4-deoxy-L-arabinose transferase-like glycosyltransferase